MPRVGLTHSEVVSAAARLADEVGFQNLAMGAVAEKLGVRTPSLYKHVDSLADLQHAVATLAMTELGDVVRDALQGKSGRDALAACAKAYQAYVTAYPGRFAATVGAEFTGPDDLLLHASARVVDSIAAMLGGYGIPKADMTHAIRTLRCAFHGFASLQVANGFQWSGDVEESLDWMIDLLDRGLRQQSPRSP